MIHNLVQNAIDALAATPAPAILIKTEATSGSAAGGVTLSITDNGPGFAQKIIANAFEPYVTTKAKGTGLGLAIVKKIIDDHKGSVEVDSEERKGTTVRLLLPLFA